MVEEFKRYAVLVREPSGIHSGLYQGWDNGDSEGRHVPLEFARFYEELTDAWNNADYEEGTVVEVQFSAIGLKRAEPNPPLS